MPFPDKKLSAGELASTVFLTQICAHLTQMNAVFFRLIRRPPSNKNLRTSASNLRSSASETLVENLG